APDARRRRGAAGGLAAPGRAPTPPSPERRGPHPRGRPWAAGGFAAPGGAPSPPSSERRGPQPRRRPWAAGGFAAPGGAPSPPSSERRGPQPPRRPWAAGGLRLHRDLLLERHLTLGRRQPQTGPDRTRRRSSALRHHLDLAP